MATNHKKSTRSADDLGTGLRPDMPPDQLKQDQEITKKYTDDDDQIAEHVHVRHPNRNVDKTDGTNAGGYKQ